MIISIISHLSYISYIRLNILIQQISDISQERFAMLTQNFLEELKFLTQMQTEIYKKVINYTINFIINQENKMKINQFIQIDEKQGDRIANLMLLLISSLVKYRTNVNDLTNDVKILKIDKEKQEFLIQKINNNLEELRKQIFRNELNDLTNLQDLQWRFQIEIASKNYKGDFKPNILLNFKINEDTRIRNNYVNADFSNLKNLQNCLLNAMKLHRSTKFKTARNSSV